MNTEERLMANQQEQIVARNRFNNAISREETDKWIYELNRLEKEENELYKLRRKEVANCITKGGRTKSMSI